MLKLLLIIGIFYIILGLSVGMAIGTIMYSIKAFENWADQKYADMLYIIILMGVMILWPIVIILYGIFMYINREYARETEFFK